jgi:hypothetical protein
MTRRGILLLGALLAGCTAPPQARPGKAGACAESSSLQSPPGRKWWRENSWRYASEDEAAAAYRRLAEQASPWPDWYRPYETVLPPGTRFQMAIGGAQTPDQPGSFGTFDRIASVADVREDLAVRSDWKPQVDRVVTYEIVDPLPADTGIVGPQIDVPANLYLPGGASQFEMKVPATERAGHLKVIAVRPIE